MSNYTAYWEVCAIGSALTAVTAVGSHANNIVEKFGQFIPAILLFVLTVHFYNKAQLLNETESVVGCD